MDNRKRICVLCDKEIQQSKAQPLLRCNNRLCTAYDIRIGIKNFDDGLMDRFKKFWEVYPKKTSKRDAIGAWVKMAPDKELFSVIIASIVAHKFKSEQWQNKQYIPYPGSFIRGRMWDNEIIEKTPEKTAPQYNMPVGGYYKSKPVPVSTEKGKAIKQKAFDDMAKLFNKPRKIL